MSITLTGTGGLFTRVGRGGKFALSMRTYQGTIATNLDSLADQFDGNRPLIGDLPSQESSWQQQVEPPMQPITTDMGNTIFYMASQDTDAKAYATDLATSLAALVAQMEGGSGSVYRSTVTASGSNISGIIGNGAFLYSVIYIPTGETLKNAIAEKGNLICTADSYANGVTPGQEIFTYTGEPAQPDVWAVDYPTGSGASQTVQVSGIDSNLIVDGNFEEWTGLSPTNWVIEVGTAGTDVVRSTVVFYPWDTTGSSISFVGDSATEQAIYQSFDGAINGIVLAPMTSYAVCIRLRANTATPASITNITVQLQNSAGAGLSSPSASPLVLAVPVGSLTLSWQTFTAEFITPRNMPSDARLAILVDPADAIDTGETVYIDSVMLVPMQSLYQQGPRVAIFSGSTPFVNGDGQVVTVANNYDGSGTLNSFNPLFQRMFNMRSLDLQLPTAASPTIADTLITG